MNSRKILDVITALGIIFTIIFVMSSCNTADKYDYYSKKENYINVTGTLTSIKYSSDLTTLYLEFENTDPVLDDSCFKIVGQNVLLAQSNGIDITLEIGERVTFVTAPMYFGDGYVMPIVALSAGGKCFLEFEDGYSNLLIWLSR